MLKCDSFRARTAPGVCRGEELRRVVKRQPRAAEAARHVGLAQRAARLGPRRQAAAGRVLPGVEHDAADAPARERLGIGGAAPRPWVPCPVRPALKWPAHQPRPRPRARTPGELGTARAGDAPVAHLSANEAAQAAADNRHAGVGAHRSGPRDLGGVASGGAAARSLC
jgi:hypothetical protein